MCLKNCIGWYVGFSFELKMIFLRCLKKKNIVTELIFDLSIEAKIPARNSCHLSTKM